jgi:hypothetical protein
MVYENIKKVYGPYLRKDGRKHVVIVFTDNSKKTVSYPKFLMENHSGRKLNFNETVDHIDGNFTNDSIENLQILLKSVHSSKDAKKLKSQNFDCEVCGIEFKLEGKRLSDALSNREKGKAGPFCGKSCAGKASHNISDFTVKEISREYYK